MEYTTFRGREYVTETFGEGSPTRLAVYSRRSTGKLYDVSRETLELAPFNGPFLKVDVRGVVASKGVQSTLWYRTTNTDGMSAGDLAIDLAIGWKDLLKDLWRGALGNVYLLAELSIDVFSNSWGKLLSVPYVSPVAETGALSRNYSGRAQTLTVSFHMDLASTTIGRDGGAPKRPYIAFGPIPETAIGTNGDYSSGDWPVGTLGALGIGLISNAQGQDTNVYEPVRVTVEDEFGRRNTAIADGVSFRARASFRRSRNKG